MGGTSWQLTNRTVSDISRFSWHSIHVCQSFFSNVNLQYDSNPFRRNKSTSRLCRSLGHCKTSCIEVHFPHFYEIKRGQLETSVMLLFKGHVACRNFTPTGWGLVNSSLVLFLQEYPFFRKSFCGMREKPQKLDSKNIKKLPQGTCTCNWTGKN